MRDGESTPVVALAGLPNSGKTTLFNALTGLRHKVGNYPGVTVEWREGRAELGGGTARVLDLPGTYSLYPRSEDERIARDVLLGLQPGAPRPEVTIIVVDACNLERGLYFATHVLETGGRACVALTMVDLVERDGGVIDVKRLEEGLGVPVVPVIARTGEGLDELRAAVGRAEPGRRRWRMPPVAEDALATVRDAVLALELVPPEAADGEALRLLSGSNEPGGFGTDGDDPIVARGGPKLAEAVGAARHRLETEGIDTETVEAECRYHVCREVVARAVATSPSAGVTRSERIDRVVTHKVFGPILYLALMALVFQAVYTWAAPFMDWIEAGKNWVGGKVGGLLGEGMFRDLIVDGVIEGVGAIVIFLPQICILFFFLTILEAVGYLARAAFLVDRFMRGVGLHGRSLIPLMSSFACAIPGIMATRAIENRRDRMVTMLVAPLMSCAARLPVYVLLIGAFIPGRWQGAALFGMYLFSVVAGLLAAWVLRKTLFRGESGTFLMELPRYRMPQAGYVLRTVGERGWVFVRQAGTVILAISVVLWALAYFPRSEELQAQADQRIEAGKSKEQVEGWRAREQIRQSYAGTLGRAMEPAIEPLGYDWRIGIGVLASFAAREVFVSSLGIVFGVGGEADEESEPLRERLKDAKWPDGRPLFNWLTALSLMVFFVLACQCMSTLAVVKRETNSWRWPLFLFGYMTVLAYVCSLVIFQGGQALGLV